MGAVLIGLFGLLGLGAILYASSRIPEEVEEVEEVEELEEVEEVEEVIDATLRFQNVYWAALTEWRRVETRYPNEWPADTDISFAWSIRNTGNVGAYFQVYLFDPGEWLYLEAGDALQVFEAFHSPTLPVTPWYQSYRINILARKITGERIGAVWTSEEIEVTYV